MADQSLPNIRLSVECTICIEIFTRPKVLSCGHSFCTVCLEQMIRVGRGSFDCPICRTNHSVGKKGVNALRDNFALSSIVDSLKTTFANQAAPGLPGRAPVAAPRGAAIPAALAKEKEEDEEEKGPPTCVRHPGNQLVSCCEQCEDTVCGQCISTKCRRLKHKIVPVKEKAEMVRIQLNLLLLGAAFSNLKDNITLGEGLVEGGRVVAEAEEVRAKIYAAHERALKFAEQRKQQYLEIVGESQSGSIDNAKTRAITLPTLQRANARLDEAKCMAKGATTATVGINVMQEVVSDLRKIVQESRQVLGEHQPRETNFEFIGYPPDGSVGELVYEKGSTIGVLSLRHGRLIVALDDRRIAGVCIGEVYQDRPTDIKWLFTLKPANYVAHVIFCTLSLRSPTDEPDQNVLIAVGQEIFIIDVNSSKYPATEDRCPAQGIKTVCPKSVPKNATITGVDWYPVPLPDNTYGFSTEFVIYTSDKCNDLTVVSTSTGQNVRVITSAVYLSLIRCHIIDDDVAMLVRDTSKARVLMINTDGGIKRTFTAPKSKPDANPTLLCWVDHPVLMAAILWVPVQSKGWEIVLYNAGSGDVVKTVRGTGKTPTGLDGLVPEKLVICFADGAVRICSSKPTQGTSVH